MNVDLALLFLRAKPLRFAAVMIVLVCVVVTAATLTMQSFQQSSEQLAEAEAGRADFYIRSPLVFVAGESGHRAANAVEEAIEGAGASSVTSGYFIFDVPTDGISERTSLIENDWRSEPFPTRLSLLEGSWPDTPGQVVVTPVLAAELGDSRVLSIAAGAVSLDVVGIAYDDFFRDDSFAFIAPGTWDTFPTMDRFMLSASLEIFWSGSVDPDSAAEAIARTIHDLDVELDITAEELAAGILDKEGRSGQDAPMYSEVFFLLLGVPLSMAFIGGWGAARFVARIRNTLRTLGVYNTNVVGIFSITTVGVLSAVLGVVLGFLIAVLARPLLDRVSPTLLGPMHDIPLLALTIVGAVVVGLGLSIFRLRLGAGDVRRGKLIRSHFVPSLRQILPTLVIVIIAIGIVCSQMSDINLQVASVYLLGFALVLLAPYAIDLVGRIRPRSMSSTLALRRTRTKDHNPTGMVVAIAGVLMLSFTMGTLLSSSTHAANVRLVSDVPPGQAHFSPPDDLPEVEKTLDELEDFVGLADPRSFSRAAMSPELRDGVVLVFETVDDLGRILDMNIPPAVREQLEQGAIARPKESPGETASFGISDSDTLQLNIVKIEGVNESYTQYGGFVLRQTIERHSVETGRTTWVYSDVTEEQAHQMESASELVGFEPGWLEVYAPPEPWSNPIEFVMLGIGVGILAGVLMAVFGATAARNLRPVLAALRSLGLPRWWLTHVVVVQVGIVLVITVVFSLLATIVATILSFATWMHGMVLVVPWLFISMILGVLFILTVLSVVISLRRLGNFERQSEH